ncbi:MAG: ParB N-terminal domain-containing protein [Prolixibacteraceae bacterium]|nr:ParB N-terminal domain-containing protein [Prolixibacteraceae bacterium]
MKEYSLTQNNGFNNEIQLNGSVSTNNQNALCASTNVSMTGEEPEAFLLPESLETGKPSNILHAQKGDSTVQPFTLEIDIKCIEPHELVMKVHRPKNLGGLKLTMKLKGLLVPIRVVYRNGRYFITEGLSRYFAALELGWETIQVIVEDLTDEEIQELYVFRNYRTKRSIEELTKHAEVVLGVLGLSQGKKRDQIGSLELADDNYSLVGKDRFEIACDILGIDISPSSLRRLILVRDFVDKGDDEVKNLKLLEKLENGQMRINQAFNVVKNYEKFKKQEGSNELTETLEVMKGENYKLYNKTCEDLSDLEDESVDSVIESCPYFQQKDYSRGEFDSTQIGLEKNVDDFVEKQVNIHRGVYKKLKTSGSLFVVLADSYDKGVDCLVVEKFIIRMVESGWKFIQKWYWVKDNPKPQNEIKRLLPNYEYCLHFVKDVKEYRFRDFINWKEGDFKVVRSSKERELSKKRENHSWTLQKPIERFRSFLSEQNVSRVLQANGFLWKELEEIDPEYRHQAPYPSVIPLLPILLTTRIGDTVLDIYNGTATTTAVALQLGRKAIGYDIDKVNHQFAAKRLQLVEQNLPSETEILALEADFICDYVSEENDSKMVA